MHVIHYASEGLSSKSEGEEWLGRVRLIIDKLDAMKQEQNPMMDKPKTKINMKKYEKMVNVVQL